MCGIIAIVRKPESRVAPNPVDLLELIEKAAGLLAGEQIAAVSEAKNCLDQVNQLLQGTSGLYALIDNENLSRDLKEKLEDLYTKVVPNMEQTLHEMDIDPEEANELIVGLRDSIWAILHDRIETFKGVMNLASKSHVPSRAGYAVLLSIQQALNAIDRMEVRGRDSAGIQITLWGYESDKEQNIDHSEDPLYRSGATHHVQGRLLQFVVKTAAEIGELGDNTAVLRKRILEDTNLAEILTQEKVRGSILGHTRWASIGVVSEANAHPLDSIREDGEQTPLVTSVQNGDIDNYLEVIQDKSLSISSDITSDAKVMPALCSSYLKYGDAPSDAFRKAVQSFEGSLAIATSIADEPGNLY